LHFAALCPENIKLVFARCGQAKIPDLIALQNSEGQTPLHYACSKPKSVKSLLLPLSGMQRFEVIALMDNEGRSVVEYALDFPKSLEVVFSYLNYPQIIALIHQKNSMNHSLLDTAAHNSSVKNRVFDALQLPELKKIGEQFLHMKPLKPGLFKKPPPLSKEQRAVLRKLLAWLDKKVVVLHFSAAELALLQYGELGKQLAVWEKAHFNLESILLPQEGTVFMLAQDESNRTCAFSPPG
jgi:hypothetical protein